MYAISHASTALAIKRGFPETPLWPLLLSVQLVEVLWVVFTFVGIEHFAVSDDHVHLDFLPYSHSVGAGIILAVVVWSIVRFGMKRPKIALALAIGIMSHIVLDIIQHEPDIRLVPLAWGPRLGLNLQSRPLADLIVELFYGIACWAIFRGGGALFAAIVIFNLLDILLMFPQPGSGPALAAHPAILPSIILVQIVATWATVWWLSRRRAAALEDAVHRPS